MGGRKKLKFSGHQTFPFRYGWLEKGVRGLLTYPDLFSREDALVLLGVGKNMVESIRHWCTVTQLVQEDAANARGRAVALEPTEIGRRLLGQETSWDPFLEDEASLWLIHWLIVSNPVLGTTWQIVFSEFPSVEFTKQELLESLARTLKERNIVVKDVSLKRDVDCFIRTYAASQHGARHLIAEESFDCPLQELGLIHASPDGEVYRFAIGPKPTLPAAVFGFAFDQYFRTVRSSARTMTVVDCLAYPGSPGRAFKLDENSLITYLEELAELTNGSVTLDETEGQIHCRTDWDGMKLLSDYYKREPAQ